jgi:hypothetical protein
MAEKLPSASPQHSQQQNPLDQAICECTILHMRTFHNTASMYQNQYEFICYLQENIKKQLTDMIIKEYICF